MRPLYYPATLLVALLFAVTACTTTPPLPRDEVMQQYEEISRLQTELREAKEDGVAYLAPEGYENAQASLDEAIEAAQDYESTEAREAADQGVAALAQARANAQTARDVMQEVLEMRQDAIDANAPQRVPERFAEAEEGLRDANRMIEEGKLEAAKRERPELLKQYSAIELAALKQGTIDTAEAAIARARENEADEYAPKTFNQAEEQLNLAVSTLEANREEVEKAAAHAERATTLAERSTHIAELVKDYDRRDFSQEEVVLWYQDRLAEIGQPLEQQIRFDQPNKEVVQSLRSAIAQQVAEADQAREEAAQRQAQMEEMSRRHEQEIAALQQQREGEIAAFQEQLEQEQAASANIQEELQKTAREIQRRYENVNAMFDASEASVYRMQDNVLVSVHGFDFPSGKAEIEPRNFGLLDKVARSVKEFGQPKVVVSGHTDSTGDADMNVALSKARAEAVAQFLREAAEIPGDRIEVEAYGEAKPVASNETSQGRAQNRRVDVLIVNRTEPAQPQ